MAVFNYLNDGGPMMWVIFGVLVIAVTITLERVFALYIKSGLNVSQFVQKIKELVERHEYQKAIEMCNQKTWHPLPSVLKAGISKSNRREKEIERAMEEKMLQAMPKMQKGVGFLALLGNTATLLGLLGTIFGLIVAFESVSSASASDRQRELSEGISMAMYTTAWGLMVAIPILFSHLMISQRMEKIMIQVEEGASGLLGALAARFKDVKSATGEEGQQ